MRKHPQGTTLLELMVVTTLIAVVALSFSVLYITSQRFLIQSSNFVSSQEEASFALEHIRRRLLLATGMKNLATGMNNPPWPPPDPNATETIHNLSTNGLFGFTWQRRDPNTQAPKDVNSAYRLNGTDLFFDEVQGSDSAQPIARHIESVIFRRTGSATVGIQVVAVRDSGGDIQRKTEVQTVISPRGML